MSQLTGGTGSRDLRTGSCPDTLSRRQAEDAAWREGGRLLYLHTHTHTQRERESDRATQRQRDRETQR